MSQLSAVLSAAGMGAVNLVNSFMPDQQGAPDYPLALFYPVTSKRYGYQKKTDTFNEDDEDFDHTESWILERTIQVSAWVKQDPADLAQMTSFDVVNAIAGFLMSEPFRLSLLASGIGIIRITDIRQTQFKDEHEQYVENPSFDFTVNYMQTLEMKVPTISDITDTIIRV